MGVFEVDQDGLTLTEINPELTVEDVRSATAAPFRVAEPLVSMV